MKLTLSSWATLANGIMGITMIISFWLVPSHPTLMNTDLCSFCIQDLEDLLNSDSDFPIISIIYNATESQAGTLVLGSILVILLFFSTVTTIASASRQIWAFSRDGVGLTFDACS